MKNNRKMHIKTIMKLKYDKTKKVDNQTLTDIGKVAPFERHIEHQYTTLDV